MARSVGLLCGIGSLGSEHPVLRRPVFGHDVDHADLHRQHCIRLGCNDAHGVGVHCFDLRYAFQDKVELGVLAAGTVEAENDVVSGQRRAVVEPHAVAELEFPGPGVYDAPRGRERRLQFQLEVNVQQSVIDLLRRDDRFQVPDRVGIERVHRLVRREAHHVLRRGGSGSYERREQRQSGEQ
jgi:hypothetical protein